jgi:mRNA interferase MazF
MGMEVKRFSVVLVTLDPTIGREIKKTRPCLVISPDEMNDWISTVIVAPMTSKGRNYPSRVNCSFEGISGQVVLDQIRSIDKRRIIKKLGRIDKRTESKVFSVLADLFAP